MYELTIKDLLIQLFMWVLILGLLFLITLVFGPTVVKSLFLLVAGFLFVMGLDGF